MSTLAERIVEAQVQMAKTAIADPARSQQWCRLQCAKTKLEAAQVEFEAAKKSWESLIEPAPAEFKKLAPRV